MERPSGQPATSSAPITSDSGQSPQRLITVSNRGPLEHHSDGNGGIERRCTAGGVSTALDSALAGVEHTWIAASTSDGDRALGEDERTIEISSQKRLRLVTPPHEAYDLHYGMFCNPLLWFVQHSIYGQLQRKPTESEVLDAWDRGYLPVNEAFAEAAIEELDRAGGDAPVVLHDYHLYAAPLFIRNMRPDATLQHFVHIPWPAPDAWRCLPPSIVQSICLGLLANDSVVFQTDAFAINFVRTCQAFLDETIRIDGDAMQHGGRRTRVWSNPVSVSIWDLRQRLASPEAEVYRERLRAPNAERTIVRVDRLDPTKNVAAGFRAYARLLEQHPEWQGNVRFRAFLVPSRTKIPEYRTYTEEVFAEVEAVNRRFGTAGWTPITVHYEQNRLQALVALSQYDVLLVNPLIDGMNLVSKEGPVLNERDGVLVLSTTTGSFAELGAGALGVRPDDIDGTAEALHTALSMPPKERHERALRLRAAVLRHDLPRWLRLLLDDVGQGSSPGKEQPEAKLAAARLAR